MSGYQVDVLIQGFPGRAVCHGGLGWSTITLLDHAASVATLAANWATWRATPGTLLIPGHDRTMRLNAACKPEYVGAITASIAAWFDEDLATTTVIPLQPMR